MRPLRILVTDDCQLTTALIAEHLRRDGHLLDLVECGEAALAHFAAQVPDVILMDLNMPGIGGLEAIRRIRAMPIARWVPIIVVAANLDAEMIEESFAAGADDYIHKPIRPAFLSMRIKTIMRIASLQRSADAVIDNVIEGVIRIDCHGRISTFNKAAEQIFGYRADEVLGQNVKLLMPEPHASQHDEYLRQHLLTGHSKIIGVGREVSGRRKNGHIFPMHLGVTEAATPDEKFFVGLIRDLTVEQALRAQLQESQRFLADVIENSAAATFVKDRFGKYQLVNRRYEQVTGKPRAEVLGRTDTELFSKLENPLFAHTDEQVLCAGDITEHEECLTYAGQLRHFLSIKFPTRDMHGEINGLCGMATDITELKRTQQELERLSQQDELTGLFNRRHFLALARNELYRSSRYHGRLCAIMLDIDHFKQINDNYGHQTGDQILASFGRLLSSCLRETDFAGRLGGEEFAVILPETDLPGGHEVAERIRERLVAESFALGDGRQVAATVSIGIAEFSSTQHQRLEEWLHDADQALYQAKQQGRNRSCLWQAASTPR